MRFDKLFDWFRFIGFWLRILIGKILINSFQKFRSWQSKDALAFVRLDSINVIAKLIAGRQTEKRGNLPWWSTSKPFIAMLQKSASGVSLAMNQC